MIEQAAYELNPLMQKIRSEHGSRKASEGTSDVGTPVQDEFRSSIGESRSTSGASIEGSPRDARDASGLETDQRTPKRRDSGKGRTDSTSNQSDGGPNSHLNPISRAFQFKQTNDGGLNEQEKPSGLYTKPNSKERAARESDQSGPSPSGQAQSKKNFFSWLRSGDNRKTSKEPRVKRTRPLTEKEIEELKPDLVEALKVSLPLLDEAIYATNKAHNKPYIYASLDDEDIDKLANFWLRRARKSGEVAAAATQFVQYRNDIEILTMMLPTFGQTFMFYKENGGFTLRGR